VNGRKKSDNIIIFVSTLMDEEMVGMMKSESVLWIL